MRIAIVIDSFMRGGAERQALYAAHELALRGCEVEVIYYYEIPDAYDLSVGKGVKFTYLPKNGTYVRFFFRLCRYLKRGRFDIVHAFKSTPCLYGCLAAGWAKTPIIIGGYRVLYDDHGLIRLGHLLVNRIVTAWIVNSKAIVDSMVRSLGARREKFFVVYNGLETERFAPSLSAAEVKEKLGVAPSCPIVSIVARLHAQKNHEMFLRMAARVLETRTDCRFLIIGDGELRGALEAQASSLGIGRQVLFLGIRSDIPDLLGATDLVVLTSHYEGLPNVLIEAMSAGVPVISTDFAGVEEVLSDDVEGFVVPRDDAEAMAARVVRLLGDESLRKRMGAAGIERVARQFSLDVMGGRLLKVYEDHFQRTRRRSGSRPL